MVAQLLRTRHPANEDQQPAPLRDWGITSIPPFRRVLTITPGHPLELSHDMQMRMALLEVEPHEETIAVVSDDFQDHPEFDNLVARAKGAGYKIIDTLCFPFSNLQLLSKCRLGGEVKEIARAGESDTQADMLLSELLEYAVKERATDVHIVIQDNDQTHITVKVKLRIDGRLRNHPYLASPSYAKQLRSMIQVVYGARIDDGSNSDTNYSVGLNQYATITMELGGQIRTLRYQSFVIQHGNRYVLRIPDERESDSIDMAKLHYAPSQLKLLYKIARQRHGAVLFCGAVNTGKTTSMQRMVLNTPHADDLHISSIEDPVEGHLMGRKVSRISVQRGAEKNRGQENSNPFAKIIRDLLRGDIDVFYMGEIRDRETGSAFEAAIQTGHKGYATLHLGSAFSAIPRLSGREIGISRESVATDDFLVAIIAQRLMPKLCPACCLPLTDPRLNLQEEQRESLAFLKGKFKIPLDKVRTRCIDADCPRCKGTGTIDRILIAEVVVPDAHMFKLWREGRDSDAKEHWRKARISGFDDPDMTGKTLFEHGLYRVAIGEVDPFELDSLIPFAFYDLVPINC